MASLRRLLLRLYHVLRPGAGESDLDRELRSHLALIEDEYVRRGLGPEAARREARLALGGTAQTQELQRDARSIRWLDELGRDIRYAVRTLRRTPGFAAAATLTLALGIGANTALFSLVNGVLLKSIPVPNLDRLAFVTRFEPRTGRVFLSISDAELRAVSASQPPLFDAFVISDSLVGSLSGGGQAGIVSGELVSGNYFPILGVLPRAGRLLQPSDDIESNTDTPIVISERLWRRWFAADPAAIGKRMTIAGYPLILVGVAPETFQGTWLPTILTADIWVPVRADRHVLTIQGPNVRTSHRVFATLRTGVTLAQANAAVDVIGRQVENSPGVTLVALAGRRGIWFDEFDHYGRIVASVFLALSGLVLLIASANLTNLLLARGTSRAGEMAVRLAIGASRRRIVQLLLTETLLVAAIGGLLGLALTCALTWAMTRVPIPALDGIVIRFDPSPDLRVFAYAFLMAALAAIVVGLVPARRAARTEPTRVLVAGGAGDGATARRRPLRTRLVAAQVAMSIVLLVGGGLYARSALAAMHFDAGYDTSHQAVATVNLSLHKIDEVAGRRLLTRMLEAARQIPGVRHAALASDLPAVGENRMADMYPEGSLLTSPMRATVGYAIVSPEFFDTAGIRVLRGRNFTEADGPGTRRVAVISERTAQRFWPNQNPIGQRVSVRIQAVQTETVTLEVVGVAANTAVSVMAARPSYYAYVPNGQEYSPKTSIVVQTRANPSAILAPLEQTLRGVDPDVAVFDVQTVRDAIGVILTPFRVTAVVLSALGVLGFAIAMLGVYGVMAYSVSQRTREFGVHRALGATAGQIHATVLRQGLRMLLVGVVPGLVMAGIGAGFLQHLLYGVRSRDPLTFVAVPTGLILAGLAASYFPARRAGRVDPTVALRDL